MNPAHAAVDYITLASALRAAATRWPYDHRRALLRLANINTNSQEEAQEQLLGAADWAQLYADAPKGSVMDDYPDDARCQMDSHLERLEQLIEPIHAVGGLDGLWLLASGADQISARATELAERGRRQAQEYTSGTVSVADVAVCDAPFSAAQERDATWQRRRLNRLAGLARAQAATTLRLAGGRPAAKLPKYATEIQTRRRREKSESLSRWAEGREIVSMQDGRRVSLTKVIESSRKAKKARAYAVCLGIAQWASRAG